MCWKLWHLALGHSVAEHVWLPNVGAMQPTWGEAKSRRRAILHKMRGRTDRNRKYLQLMTSGLPLASQPDCCKLHHLPDNRGIVAVGFQQYERRSPIGAEYDRDFFLVILGKERKMG